MSKETQTSEVASPDEAAAAPAVSGVQLESHQVILRPLVTEKGMHRSTRHNQYAFEVNPLATKTDIRKAVEELFEVHVEKVCTRSRKGKLRRHKFKWGKTKSWKKVIVTLNEEDSIDFF